MRLMRLAGGFVAVAAVVATTGCGADDGPGVIAVPGDHATIQAAVDAAEPGDLVVVNAGTYHERVVVTTDGVTIRGVDRNTVVLDGRHDLIDGVVVTADGVAVENLTVRNYRQNGVIVNGAGGDRDAGDDDVYGTGAGTLDGYRISYVTAANNGTYGIYAFASRNGLIEHSLASGSPDSGIYVGQCKPCDVVITDSIAEYNAIGYYGTNATGGVYVVDSIFRHNRLGMTPNSQAVELLAPQAENVLAGNLVHDNDDPAAPAIAQGFFGGGIAIGGGTGNLVLRNRVMGHEAYGIGVLALNDFDPIGNRVEGNVVEGNTLDLYFELRVGEAAAFDNCFVGNEFSTSSPADIETELPCGADGPVGFDATFTEPPPPPPNVDYREIPLPAPQPNRPGDPNELPPAPAGMPSVPELDAIDVPEAP